MHASNAHRLLEDWRRCKEKVLGTCSEVTDRCCAVVPCRLCLTLEVYGEADILGQAVWNEDAYVGEINDETFYAYWERNDSGDCQFVVELDGEEVYRKAKCGGGYDEISCRSPDDETALGDGNTLVWEAVDPLKLRHQRDGKCNKPFCGDCTCFPRKFCVTITEIANEYNISDLCTEKLEVTALDDCENPTWMFESECGLYGANEFTITLYADEYTNQCMLELSGAGETLTQEVSGCDNVSVTFETELLEIALESEHCGCEPDPPRGTSCCDWDPLNPEPPSVNVSFCGCTINLQLLTPGATHYSGTGNCGVDIDGSFRCITSDEENANQYELWLNCNPLGPNPVYAVLQSVSCDPFVVSGVITFECEGLCGGGPQPVVVTRGT